VTWRAGPGREASSSGLCRGPGTGRQSAERPLRARRLRRRRVAVGRRRRRRRGRRDGARLTAGDDRAERRRRPARVWIRSDADDERLAPAAVDRHRSQRSAAERAETAARPDRLPPAPVLSTCHLPRSRRLSR